MWFFDRLASLANFLNLRKKQVNVLVVGLNNSGKSTVINRLKRQDDRCINIVPTVGYNVEKVAFGNMNITAFDMSGHERHRSLWEHYYRDCHGIIFVIDSSDKLRLVVVKEELEMLLQHPDVAGRRIPLLFLANKMDLSESFTTAKLVAGLGLERIQNKPWHIRATDSITGQGLQPAIEWLTDQIRDIYVKG